MEYGLNKAKFRMILSLLFYLTEHLSKEKTRTCIIGLNFEKARTFKAM